MILSHKHKFIYIKTKKTASSSIEIALSEICGPDDVITPTRSDLEAMRKTPGQNYRLDHPLVPKRPLIKRLLMRPERHYHPSVGYFEHIAASRVRAYVGEAIWSQYYKFTFERNPWDRQVSWYKYKTRDKKNPPSFDTFNESFKRAYVGNFDLYSMDDEIVMDYVGCYEDLAEDFPTVLSKIGLSGKIELGLSNMTGSSPGYRDYYTDRSRDLMAKWYAREIKAFGYSF